MDYQTTRAFSSSRAAEGPRGGRIPLVLAPVGSACLVLSGCGNSGAVVGPPGHEVPSQVAVKCSPDGTSVSTRAMTTRTAGVVLVVSSTMGPKAYLNCSSDGSGSFAGGEPVSRRQAHWVLPLAPGTATLACTSGGRGDAAHSVHLQVLDPSGFWRGDALARAGCDPSGGQPSWVAGLHETAPTARGAVQRMIEAFEQLAKSQGNVRTYTSRPARIGYPAAPTETWVVSQNGDAAFTVDEVTHVRNGYTASPDALCRT